MKKKDDMEVIRVKEEEIEVIPPSSIRSTRFTDESFEDANVMVYEKSNAFALSYYGMSRVEQSLLCAGLVSAYDVNKRDPYDQYAIEHGIQVYTPIRDVARLMGYNLNDRSFYKTIKRAAGRLTNNGQIMIEDEDRTGFSVYNIITQVDYNYNKSGYVRYVFSPGASSQFLNNETNFTLYSLILRNKIENSGQNAAVRMYEILETDLFKVKSQKRPLRRYYDYVDLRCKLYLINTNNETVKKIMSNKRYNPKEIETNNELAYERLMRIESLDTITRENIRNLKNSERYKKIVAYRKSDEFKEVKAKLKQLKSGPEYDSLYQEKILPVEELESEIQNLNNLIVSQYPDWSDFKKRILVPAQKAFLEAYQETDLMDMMFEYEPVYYKYKVIGVTFTIYTVDQYQQKEKEKGVQMSIFDYMSERKPEQSTNKIPMYEDGGANKTGIAPKPPKKKEKFEATLEKFEEYVKQLPDDKRIDFSAVDLLRLSKLADFDILKEKYNMMMEQGNAKNPVAWMTSAVKENWMPSTNINKNKKEKPVGASVFNHFMQRDYDFEELEKEILANNSGIEINENEE